METLLSKHKDRVPIIVKNNNEKYLIKKELQMSEFMVVLRKKIKIDSKKAIFIFVGNGVLVPMHLKMGELHNIYHDPDMLLYITYKLENTFG
jgi:GABA(A) receptor-associated protein